MSSSDELGAARLDATKTGPDTLLQVTLTGVPGVAAGQLVDAYSTRLLLTLVS